MSKCKTHQSLFTSVYTFVFIMHVFKVLEKYLKHIKIEWMLYIQFNLPGDLEFPACKSWCVLMDAVMHVL